MYRPPSSVGLHVTVNHHWLSLLPLRKHLHDAGLQCTILPFLGTISGKRETEIPCGEHMVKICYIYPKIKRKSNTCIYSFR